MTGDDMNDVLVIQGADGPDEVDNLNRLPDDIEVRYATSTEQLSAALPGANMMLGWAFKSQATRAAWPLRDRLEWIHWCGAGVDALLFEELRDSDVVLTNSRGVFDRSMAEFTLGAMISFAKQFTQTWRFQQNHDWQYRETEQLLGQQVLVVGVGSIGREIGRMLRAFGLEVEGVGRRARSDDPDFNVVHAVDGLDALLPRFDYVVLITPGTAATNNLFGGTQFQLMKQTSRFINLSRGTVVDEAALIQALNSGEIAGAALDVYETEPLPQSSPLWDMDNVFVSPHMSGDYIGHMATVMDIFLDNVNRFRAGEPLNNIVDKRAGFVSS